MDKEEAGKNGDNQMTSRQSAIITEIKCAIPGKRSFDIRGVNFTIDEKYEVFKVVGVGAYGIVVACQDKTTGERVALKKISGVFDDFTDAKRILREIRLMQALKHENLLPLYDMEAPDSFSAFDEVYMTSPLFDKDLCKIIESDVELTVEHIRYFIYQILCGLKHLHSASVMHRDLKPANILVKESCDLTLCDFGLARYVEEKPEEVNLGMTEYVVTRWYRAPELVLVHEYTYAVDLWAVGCILGDLFGRKVMFPGKDFKNQVELICTIIGKPNEDDMKHVTSSRARKFLEKLPDTNGIPFDELFPNAPKQGIDLMQKLLKFNPNCRLTAEEALQHPFVAEFHDEEYEASVQKPRFTMADIEPVGKNGELKIEDIKEMMMKEIHKFRPNAEVYKRHPELIPK